MVVISFAVNALDQEVAVENRPDGGSEVPLVDVRAALDVALALEDERPGRARHCAQALVVEVDGVVAAQSELVELARDEGLAFLLEVGENAQEDLFGRVIAARFGVLLSSSGEFAARAMA